MITAAFDRFVDAITDFLSDMFRANGIRPKSLLCLTHLVFGIVRPGVQLRVFVSLDKLKILDSIIEFVAIDVMHMFGEFQRTTKILFHDMAMLSYSFSVNNDDSITALVNRAALDFGTTGALGRAEDMLVNRPSLTFEFLSAILASQCIGLFANEVGVLPHKLMLTATRTEVAFMDFAWKTVNALSAMGTRNNRHICLQYKTLFAGAINVLAEGTWLTGKECRKQYMKIASYCQTIFPQHWELYHSLGVFS